MVLAWWWIIWLSRKNRRRKAGTSAGQKQERGGNLIAKVCKRIIQLKHNIGYQGGTFGSSSKHNCDGTSATMQRSSSESSNFCRSFECECSRTSSSKTRNEFGTSFRTQRPIPSIFCGEVCGRLWILPLLSFNSVNAGVADRVDRGRRRLPDHPVTWALLRKEYWP